MISALKNRMDPFPGLDLDEDEERRRQRRNLNDGLEDMAQEYVQECVGCYLTDRKPSERFRSHVSLRPAIEASTDFHTAKATALEVVDQPGQPVVETARKMLDHEAMAPIKARLAPKTPGKFLDSLSGPQPSKGPPPESPGGSPTQRRTTSRLEHPERVVADAFLLTVRDPDSLLLEDQHSALLLDGKPTLKGSPAAGRKGERPAEPVIFDPNGSMPLRDHLQYLTPQESKMLPEEGRVRPRSGEVLLTGPDADLENYKEHYRKGGESVDVLRIPTTPQAERQMRDHINANIDEFPSAFFSCATDVSTVLQPNCGNDISVFPGTLRKDIMRYLEERKTGNR
ncbi:MAG: hypothetical protein HQL82_01960 [Magnetococcales bacterium]|nr:hypothetical protein [Magnetococcales bacterium]